MPTFQNLGIPLCPTIDAMIDPSEVILVGLQSAALGEALQARLAPACHLVDFVNC